MQAAHGLPLGLMPGKAYGKEKIELTKEMRLISFTDGVTEAENSQQELYGEERLKDFILANAHKSSEQLIELLIEDLRSFVGDADQSDDITLLLLNKIRSSSS
jgi:sigma-B regulation protein RsbU (phosphoserine phosphatase)